MKWILELSDVPLHEYYPIVGYQEVKPGVKSAPRQYSIEQVIEILEQRDLDEGNASLHTKRQELEYSPILPEGTVMYASEPDGMLEQLVFEIQSKTFDVQHSKMDGLHAMPFPRMVVVVELQKVGKQKKIDAMRLFAVANDGQPLTEETPLFTFPYPNVMKSSGSVCWGQNERLMVNTLQEVRKAFLLFFSAPFNEDHGVRTALGLNHFRALIEKLADQPFDDEWLMPHHQTLGEMIKETSY